MSSSSSSSPAKRAKTVSEKGVATKTIIMDKAMDDKCIATIRTLSADVVQKANSGHPGAPMGCAPMAHVLFSRIMNFSPTNPKWPGRDRFVLSNGHGCALLYVMLYLSGYERPNMEDLKQFRQLDSVTAGHPENHLLDGVEVSTGPLGQGISNAVGLAIAECHLEAVSDSSVINNYTYVICGDGCLQEGISSEACSLAGHLGLGKLIVLYDDNNITIDGETNLSFTEDVLKRYEAYGWQVLVVGDGDKDLDGIEAAIREAQQETDKPSMIKVRTTIGFGSSKEGTEAVHGAPLGNDDIKAVKAKFGIDPEKVFFVPDDVKSTYQQLVSRGKQLEEQWNAAMQAFAKSHPEKHAELARRLSGKLPSDWESKLPTFTVKDGSIATRNSSGKVLNAVADAIPDIMGGSADLTPSNKTEIKSTTDFQKNTPAGRYLRFGVREHAMSAICNGLAAYGGIIPFGATFLNFAGYALGAMRLSALSHFRVLYIMTHDSIGLGEDGPTHQPIGMFATLRSIPNMYFFRPADAKEVVGCYKQALLLEHSPSVLALSRQNLPTLETTSADNVAKGAYTIHSVPSPKLVIAATGSEVFIAMDAAASLNSEGMATNVVSMPCLELFELQPLDYRKGVFPQGCAVVSVEAAGVLGWAKYSHMQIGMRDFGKSAPGDALYEFFGFTAPKIAAKCKATLKHFEGKQVPWLMDMPQL